MHQWGFKREVLGWCVYVGVGGGEDIVFSLKKSISNFEEFFLSREA